MKKKHMTARDVWVKFGRAESLSINTVKHTNEVDTHLDRWEQFHGGIKIRKIEKNHMEEWRRHLISQGYSPRTINKHLASLRRALVIALDMDIIQRRPTLRGLTEHTSPATKIYFRNDQIDALFETATQLTYPRGNVDPATFWRAALVMYRTYGFRPQEVLTYEKTKHPLTWDSIVFDIESPDVDSHEKCAYGWLSYTPPKTRKKKPTPITIPLTSYARGALNAIYEHRTSNVIFPIPMNPESFFNTWHKWMEIAGVKAKQDMKLTPKHLRKTAATYHNAHKPGLATAVCRWGSSDQSGSPEAAVAINHYISNDMLLREIHNSPMPESFSWAHQFVQVVQDPCMILSKAS